MSTAIAVFVKTPGLSPLKTRLAAGIGHQQAQKFYLMSLQAVQHTIQDLAIKPFWSVAEIEALNNPLWQSFESMHTGEGNLGQRQHHIYEALLKKHAKVLLIGADTPQISQATIQQAMAVLDTNDFVIGPARDGGYYLFGGRISTAQHSWTSVPWSTSITREKLQAALPSKVVQLETLTDVDTKSDLNYVEAEMPIKMNQAQKHLMAWINHFQQAKPTR